MTAKPVLPVPVASMGSSMATTFHVTDITVTIPQSTTTSPPPGSRSSPSRWKTPEFKIYFAILFCALPAMIYIPFSLSRVTHPNYGHYRSRLSEGWMFGRMVDNSDIQYRGFRSNIPILALAIIGHWLLKRVLFFAIARTSGNVRNFNLVVSLTFVTVLHGTSIFKIIPILAANYFLAKRFGGERIAPLVVWVFNIVILFANDRFSGYPYSTIAPFLRFLDDYQGLYPRWYINYNISMLRMVSFSMDYYWACTRSSQEPTNLEDLKQRTSSSHALEAYTFADYLSYVLYAPLYIAGPIITFNDYLHQLHRPLVIRPLAIASYGVRFIVSLLTMEAILHFMYVVAIKDKKAWDGDSPAEISMIAFWNLIIMWLKLLIPWRFFRLWSLVDGIDPPENMIRCVANNYSMLSFWRSWHRSYNLWLIRYIYIPLQGSSSPVIQFRNTALIFTFVALWHDLTFKLLAWGWMVSFFILPEIIGRIVLPQKKYGDEHWYRHVCALAGAFNVLLMMAANLVGFVVGLSGLEYYLDRLLGTGGGLAFLTVTVGCLFVGVQLMFEYREEEKRVGIHRRC
ncbi:MBOAT, membrane-bound O-acyltransferase family-domain-containing protein [Flagelloscypha sp. PMI_526]|nr:MBOAT, membrane-bound O-acyltransferase family-domain-containing protein [Flagelloscypha sp. PMI_526]